MEKYIITMLGEKDHGKSTLIGNLLIATGTATDARIKEARNYSKKGRFEPAYILDSFSEEREQEMTIDTTRAEIVYKNSIFEFIDVPGHLELIKNMMSGASHGEIAVLLLSMKEGEGLQPQTKRHVYVANLLGITALIVAINKMDLTGYSEIAFKKMRTKISEYLNTINFSRPVVYIPIVAYDGENLVKPSDNMNWYKGKTLIDEIASLAGRKESSTNGKLRVIVQDVVEDDDKEMIFCILHSGSIKVGQKIKLEPTKEKAIVKEIYLKGEKASSAKKGSNIAVVLEGDAEIRRGFVFCGENERVHNIRRFTAHAFFIKKLSDKKIEVKMNNNAVVGKIVKVDRIISPISGVSKRGSAIIPEGNAARVEIELAEDYPIEKFEHYKELGRFALYSDGAFHGIGIVV